MVDLLPLKACIGLDINNMPPLPWESFRKIFWTAYPKANHSILRPKSDVCDLCYIINKKLISLSRNIDNNVKVVNLQKELESHLEAANDLRVKVLNLSLKPDTQVLAVDFMGQLALPKGADQQTC